MAIGQRVGPYVILDHIGRGGMGQVFLANDPRLRRKVALKYLYAALHAEDTVRMSILREAEAVARITHQNVAMVYDVVEHDDQTFIVMEYVEGETLSTRLGRERLPGPMVLRFGRQLCSGLAAAHAKGIVHRDLKPSNIQVTPDDTVKILDFGVAMVRELLSTVTATASVTVGSDAIRTTPIGTLGYMSPEQMRGELVDVPSDLFSLGTVLFEMATGQRLFPGNTAAEIVAAMSKPFVRADEIDPHVSRQLSDLVANLLEIDPRRRVQSAVFLESRLAALESTSSDEDRSVARNLLAESSVRELRRRLILATGPSEVVRLKYEIEQFLAERPHDVDGRLLKDDVERALSASYFTAGTRAGMPRTVAVSRTSRVWYAAGLVLAIAFAGSVLVQVVRKSRTDQPPVTTTSVPPGPTAEQRFQGHFNKAQEFIAKPDKQLALAENTQAMTALPDDPRGLKQKAEIDAMLDSTPLVDPTPIAEGTKPPTGAVPTASGSPSGTTTGTTPSTTTPGTATPGTTTPSGSASTSSSSTLKVDSRPGESGPARANREKTAKTHLDDAKKALEDRHYADAMAAAQRAIDTSGRADFGTSPNEANSIVAKAKAGQAAEENQTRTANAQKLVEQARALASSNNVLEALNKLREARMLSPQAVNQELERSLLDQARKLGEAALATAKYLDVNDNRREEALKAFERAAQFLDVVPGGHPGLAYAKQRVTDLKSGR